jgi:non-heme chloroperoxidase
MAQTIVMIHGMWAGGWLWENYRRFFEERGYACLIPTLRLHDVDPKAPPPDGLGTTSLLDYAADLEKQIRQLDRLPILMGHSMGGLIAQIVANRGLASALVLLSSAPPGGIFVVRPSMIKSLSSCLRWGFWNRPIRQKFAEAVYSSMHLIPAEEQRSTYDRYVYESGRALYEMGFWFLDLKRASRVNGATITFPVLVIAGSEDRLTPTPLVRKIAARYGSSATYREYRHHAHRLIHEPGWQEIAADIADWLEKA